MSEKKKLGHLKNTDNENTILIPDSAKLKNIASQPQQNGYTPQQGGNSAQYIPPQQNGSGYGYPQAPQGAYQGQPQYRAPQQPQPNGYPQHYRSPQQQGGNHQAQYISPQQNNVGGYSYPQAPQGAYQGQPQYRAPQQQNGYPQQYRTPQQGGNGYGYPQAPQSAYQGQPQYRVPPPPMPPQSGGYPVQQPQPQKQPKKKHKKKKHKSLVGKIIRRVLLSLLIIFLLLFGIYSCTSLSVIKKMNRSDEGSRQHMVGTMSEKYVRNILIIGTDGRTASDRGRSDSMILLSINSKTNKMTMASFLRDCYVDIPGRGKDKLNAAYSYGGPALLMDTIESNFNVRIDDYVSINFSTFASIIDAAGGLDLELSDEEAEAVNVILISEVNELMGDGREDDLLSGGGKLHLSGKQVLSYSRIRSVGKWDFERTSRQRKVMTAFIKKAGSHGFSFIRKLTKDTLPSVTTNMTTSKLYLLSLRLPFIMRYKLCQLQIPAENTYRNVTGTPSGEVLELDFEANIELIKKE